MYNLGNQRNYYTVALKAVTHVFKLDIDVEFGVVCLLSVLLKRVELQHDVNNWLIEKKLSLNSEKTKQVIFKKSTKSKCQSKASGEGIEKISSFKYLEMNLYRKLIFLSI